MTGEPAGPEPAGPEPARWGEAPAPLPMFPLSSVLFPHGRLTLHVFEHRYRVLTTDCLAGDRQLGVVLITRGSEVGGGDQRAATGTVARVDQALPMPDGRWFLVLEGVRRFQVVGWLPDAPYPRALVQGAPDGGGSLTDEALGRATAALRRARALGSEAGHWPALPDEGLAGMEDDPGRLAWWLCSEAPVGPLDRQRLLEAGGEAARLELLAELCEGVADDLTRMLAGG